jgi:TonB family protein
MVYTAELKKIQKKIFLPVNISVLTSVGIHALFFSIILPKWDFTDSQKNKKPLSNTPVIELNSLERTRLPDLSPRQWSNWALIPPLEGNNSENPQINPPELNSFQFPLINNSGLPNLPPPPSISSLPSISIYSDHIPSPLTLPPPPPLNPIDSTKTVRTLPPEINGEIPNIAIKQPEKNSLRDSLFPPTPNQVITSPRVLINRHNNSPETTQSQEIASNLSNSSNNNNNNNNNNLSPQTQVAVKSPPVKPSNYSELTSALQEDVSNTSAEEATKNDLAWRIDVKIAQPKRLDLIGVYPKDACLRKLEGNAAYGVMVNGQGQPTNTQLLRSAGLPIFNQQALKQIQSRNFSATGQPQAYHVYVDFKPNNCPTLSIDNLGKIPPKKQALPQTNEENAPKPQQNQQLTTSPSPLKPETDQVNQSSTSSPVENKPAQATSNTVTTQPPKPEGEISPLPTQNQPPVTSNSNININQLVKPEVNDSSSINQGNIEDR